MYGSIITLLVKGVSDVGGLAVVWERNVNSSRIEFFKSVNELSIVCKQIHFLLIRFTNYMYLALTLIWQLDIRYDTYFQFSVFIILKTLNTFMLFHIRFGQF